MGVQGGRGLDAAAERDREWLGGFEHLLRHEMRRRDEALMAVDEVREREKHPSLCGLTLA